MLSDDVKRNIQTSYSQYLKAKGHKPRYGQKLMIAAIARVLAAVKQDSEGHRSGDDAHVCVVEAGTGTGKTVAYLLAVLPIAQALGKKVVVSTATIALQEQIVFKDLPDLHRNSGLHFDFALVKGRGRYLCLSKLDQILSDQSSDGLFPGIITSDQAVLGLSPEDIALYNEMMATLSSGSWDGDRDSWPNELEPARWARVTTDHRQCTGRRCRFVRQCSFFKARDSLHEVDCMVANHDLVLADLALGGGAILPPTEDTIFILDEAHHLPDKAVSHFASHCRVVSTSRWLGMVEGQWQDAISPLSEATAFTQLASPVESLLKTARLLLDSVQPLLAPYIEQVDRSAQTPVYRFPSGQASEELEGAAIELASVFSELHHVLEDLCKELDRLLDDDYGTVPEVDLEQAYPLFGSWCSRAEANVNLWRSYSDTRPKDNWPIARWLSLHVFEDSVDFELVSSPVLASKTLADHLWDRCYAAVATSATLAALGSFDRFRLRAGTPENSSYELVPSPFNFQENGVLRVPKSAEEGNQAEAHTQSIIRLLPKVVDSSQGTLVLFSSKRQMNEVFEGLGVTWQNRILMQGIESKHALLQKHRKAIDASRGSVLFGLASLAEGLDLPGDYCRHVIIAKLPFAVPDDPVESAMAEWIEQRGGNSFMQVSVPDAAIKMVQACGRLLRTENDSGVITVLDRRLVSKRYGKAILDSLPPFKLELSLEL